MMRLLFVLVLLLASAAQPVLAHNGGAIPADVWTHWTTDPLMLIAILLPLSLFVRGAATYRLDSWRVLAFVGAIITLFVALISPLGVVSHSLFSGHMVQHLLLVLVAAPLLTLSRPMPALLRGLPPRWRKSIGKLGQSRPIHHFWGWLIRPTTAVILHIVALWIWHIPVLYSAALENPLMHLLEHASFFLTAALFWWMIVRTDAYGGRVLCVFIVMMASGLLGALMTFARNSWYFDHAAFVDAWGLTLLEDQQLAGLFMWIPAGVVYVVTAAFLLSAWLNAVEQRTQERENRLIREGFVKELSDASSV